MTQFGSLPKTRIPTSRSFVEMLYGKDVEPSPQLHSTTMTQLFRITISVAAVLLNISSAHAIGDSAGCPNPIDTRLGQALDHGSPSAVENILLGALEYHEKQLGRFTTDATRKEFRRKNTLELLDSPAKSGCYTGPVLNFAAKGGNLEVVRYLLGSPLGITLNVRPDTLATVCDTHHVFHRDTPEEIERRKATVNLLMDSGKVDIHAVVGGKTILQWCKNPDLIPLLIERGADVNVEYDGHNLLDVAVMDAAQDWGDDFFKTRLRGLERAKIFAKLLPATIVDRLAEKEVMSWCTRGVNSTAWTSHACREMATFIKASPGVFGTPGTEKPNCDTSGLALPKDYSILAAGAYSGRELSFQIDQSGYMAHQVDATVNSPEKPVVLMLGGSNPIIWNVKWSPGTKILAVVVSGSYRQAVAGLEPTVRVLNSSSDLVPNLNPNRAHDGLLKIVGPCGEWTGQLANHDYFNLEDVDLVARHLFWRPTEHKYRAKDGQVLIGNPLKTGAELLNSPATTPMSFYDKNAPVAGRAALDVAVQKGQIRAATEEDFDAVRAWRGQPIKGGPYKTPSSPPGKVYVVINGVTYSTPSQSEEVNAYVVLKPFVIPANLPNGVSLIVPKGVPRPTGFSGYMAVTDMNVPLPSAGRAELEQAVKAGATHKSMSIGK